MKAKNFFRASCRVIDTTPLYALPSAACNSCAQVTSVSWLRHWCQVRINYWFGHGWTNWTASTSPADTHAMLAYHSFILS